MPASFAYNRLPPDDEVSTETINDATFFGWHFMIPPPQLLQSNSTIFAFALKSDRFM